MFVVVLSIYFNLQPTELRVEILFNTKVTSCDVECFKMVCNYLTQRINILLIKCNDTSNSSTVYRSKFRMLQEKFQYKCEAMSKFSKKK